MFHIQLQAPALQADGEDLLQIQRDSRLTLSAWSMFYFFIMGLDGSDKKVKLKKKKGKKKKKVW